MGIPPELYGPAGALVALALGVVGLARVAQILWHDHQRADLEDRRQRDEAIQGWRDATKAVNRLAAAQEARNRRDARSRRSDDA